MRLGTELSSLTKQQQSAIGAIAEHFSATPANGDKSADAYLIIRGKRTSVQLGSLPWGRVRQGNGTKIGLRFDRVVTSITGRLQATLDNLVPPGVMVLMTITAPIRLPAQTTAALVERTRILVSRGAQRHDTKAIIHGNRIRIRLIADESRRAHRVAAFVHNPDINARLLLNAAAAMVRLTGQPAGRKQVLDQRKHCLVLMAAADISALHIFRHIYSQLGISTGFKKIFVAFRGGKIRSLLD